MKIALSPRVQLAGLAVALLPLACNSLLGLEAFKDADGGVGGSATGGGATGGSGGGMGGSIPTGPNCEGLAADCGPGRDESCCAAEQVPGGLFNRINEESYPATVAPFSLDRYEVTLGRFRTFVDAGLGTQLQPPAGGDGENPNLNPGEGESGWNDDWNVYLAADRDALELALKCGNQSLHTWRDSAGPGFDETLPMNCLTWFDAFAFCIWDGGRLPTEAEWNFAAAGGDQHRLYPWLSAAGDPDIDCAYASYDCSCKGNPPCAITDITWVGSLPQGNGLFGHADLAGNMQEWALDWYVSPYAETSCVNCANLTAPPGTPTRVLRGGSFTMQAVDLRNTTRNFGEPGLRFPGYGVRCARDLPSR